MPIPQNFFRNTACACGCSDGGIKVRTAGAPCLSTIRAARYDWGDRRLNLPVTRSRQESIIVILFRYQHIELLLLCRMVNNPTAHGICFPI